jgi:hypothetical protein
MQSQAEVPLVIQEFMLGGTLQCAEYYTLGLPFAALRAQRVSQWGSSGGGAALTFRHVLQRLKDGSLLKSYFNEFQRTPHLCFSGGLFLLAKDAGELVADVELEAPFGSVLNGLIAGTFAGTLPILFISPIQNLQWFRLQQVDPTSKIQPSTWTLMRSLGIRGLYSQSGWFALSQGSTWGIRHAMVNWLTGGECATVREELGLGFVAGVMAALLSRGLDPVLITTAKQMNQSSGKGFFSCYLGMYRLALFPTILLGCSQTLFLISGPNLYRKWTVIPW